jgi:hypothetical protein
MARAAGGEGWSACSTTKRVLVTHRDGRQTVEELKDDLGVDPKNRRLVLRILQEQGINAIDVELHGKASQRQEEEKREAAPHGPMPLSRLAKQLPETKLKLQAGRPTGAEGLSMRDIFRYEPFVGTTPHFLLIHTPPPPPQQYPGVL